MVRVMNEVASGTELAVFVLMVISAHLLSENRLVLHKFLHSVGEEAVCSIGTVASFTITLAELKFSLVREVSCSFIINQIDTHLQ